MKTLFNTVFFIILLILPLIWKNGIYVWAIILVLAFLFPILLPIFSFFTDSYFNNKWGKEEQNLRLNIEKQTINELNIDLKKWNSYSKDKKEEIIKEHQLEIKRRKKLTDELLIKNYQIRLDKKLAIYRDKYGKISKEIISQLIEESKQETKYEFEMLPELEKKATINKFEKISIRNKQNEERRKLLKDEKNRAQKLKEDQEKAEKEKRLNEKAKIELKIELEKIELQKEKSRLQRIEEDKIRKEKEYKDKIKRKVLETEKKKQLEKEAIQELLDSGDIDYNYYSGNKIREAIPSEVKITVWERDNGKCVNCDSKESLEYDHIIPVSKGGANSVTNIQLLCLPCNRKKSNKIM